MNNKPLLALATILSSLITIYPAQGETVIEKIKNTGILTVGVRKNLFPLAFEKNQQWQGYSIDLIKLIQKDIEEELKKSIQIDFLEVTTQNRIPSVVSNQVDIVCDSTSFTWHRNRFVDFSIPYFVTGTQLLVKANSGLNNIDDLKLKKIGVISTSTNEATIIKKVDQAIIVAFDSAEEGFLALEKGDIDAFAWDGVLLAGLQQNSPNPASFKIIPNPPLDTQSYSCVFPENNSDFGDIVNYSLVNFMEGVTDNQTEDIAILKRWFSGNNYDEIIEYFESRGKAIDKFGNY
jgi:polar amino acid transport system substrate-binding protein